MLYQKWGLSNSIPKESSQQQLLKPIRVKKTLPLTADPISPINKERIAYQLKYEKENFPSLLFTFPVQKGMECEAIYSLLKISENVPSVFSATYLPNRPNIIFIESSDRESCISIIKEAIINDNSNSIFLGKSVDSLKELDNSEILESFCYPIQFLSLSIGSIVRIKDPEFQNEPAQIVNINSDTGCVMVKMYGHIDYRNLSQFGLTSQKALNLKMPNYYRADPAPFEESFFTRHSAKIEIKRIKISMVPEGETDMIYWDGNYYCDKFMYIEFPIKSILTQNLEIKEEEFQRFLDSRLSWEITNKDFIDHMNRTVVIKPINNIPFSQPVANISLNSSSNDNNNNEIGSSFSLQNDLLVDHYSPPPMLQSVPSTPSTPSTPAKPVKEAKKEKKSKSKSTKDQTEEKEVKKKKSEKEKKEKEKEKKKVNTKSSLSSTHKSASELTVGSSGIITKRNLPCVIRKIVNSTLLVDTVQTTIAGNVEAFREPGKYEMALINRNKYKYELLEVEKKAQKSIQTDLLTPEDSKRPKVKRKKKIHSILSESDSDEYSYDYSEEEEEPKKAKKKVEFNIDNNKNQTKSIQTAPLTFRNYDMVEMNNGEIGVIVSPRISTKLSVHLISNKVLENVDMSDFKKIIPDQGFVLDLSGRQILLNDNVFYNNQIRKVIRMHNRKLFVRDDKDRFSPFYEWIEANKALTNYLSDDLLLERKDSIIGKTVHKITNGMNSHPYKIEAVSKKGCLLSSDEKGFKNKFKFNDIGKSWSFD